MRPLPLTAAGIVASVEAAGAMNRHLARSRLYEQAQERARELGRPLLVVGDPDAGAHTSLARAYGCGNECVDLNGCPSCPTQAAIDITKPTGLPDDSRVVFVSCVLEYVDDFSSAWREIVRVAGSKENVFVATVQPWSLTSTLYPGANWKLHDVSTDGRPTYVASEVSGLEKVAALGLVVGLLAWAFCPKRKVG